MKLKMPPKIKVLEALGAIADGRIHKLGEGKYEVISSEGDRKYTVIISGNKVFSDDNGTKFRGYVGYPIISALILEGKLDYNDKIAQALKGIPWKKLNEQEKKYSLVEEIIRKELEGKGIKWEEVEEVRNKILEKLKHLSLEKM